MGSKKSKFLSAKNEDQLCVDCEYYLSPHAGDKSYPSTFRNRFRSTLRYYQPDIPFACLIGLNAVVFGAWKLSKHRPALEQFLWRHFTVSYEHIRQKHFHTLLTCNFSHMDFWHVGLNMVVTYGFSAALINSIGVPRFIPLYIGAGLCSATASILKNRFITNDVLRRSVGASGCIYGVIAAFVLHYPTAPLNFVFFPWYTFPAKYGVAGLLSLDMIGIIRGWKLFDHSAHLGGFAFGSLYWYWLKSLPEANDPKGMKLIEEEAIYVGPLKDYIAQGPAVIQSSSWTYYGELEEEMLTGKGCLRSETQGWTWCGEFINGEMNGGGLLHTVDSAKPQQVIFKNNEFISWKKHLKDLEKSKLDEEKHDGSEV